uniref:Ribonuclease H-like domain-containing protein n=1 Tax=Tanacetum cinerariifolium TaxID=118510 RepID=A0A699GPY2_TANCI|nr:ribonuclease H-like domain-containing protein [Tanacetum cinerariifolium]
MSVDESIKEHTEVSTLNFFDHFESEPVAKIPLSPNDDEEASYGKYGRVHQPVNGSTIEQPRNDGNHPETPLDEQNISEGNVGIDQEVPIFQNDLPNVTKEVGPRRSQRSFKLPARLNEFVLDNKVKYGLNRYANHSFSSAENYSFVSNLIKSIKHSSYEEAIKDVNWIKYKSNGKIERYKARLVAKGFGQKEGIDYAETFSLVLKISTVRCLINLAFQKNKKIYQMDVNNAFLYGDLLEDVYMLPSSGFSSRDESKVGKLKKSLFGLKPDISYLVHCLSQHMHAPFKFHFDFAMRVLKYLKLAPSLGVNLSKGNNDCLITAFSDFDWAKCPVTRRSVFGICVYINGNLVSWKSKRKATLSMSSTEFKYRCMSSTTYEIMWIVKILSDFAMNNLILANLYCDNKSTIQIAANPVMHEKTKHFDIDVHLVREKVSSGLIKTMKVESKDNVVDILTKALGLFQHGLLTKKLGFHLTAMPATHYYFNPNIPEVHQILNVGKRVRLVKHGLEECEFERIYNNDKSLSESQLEHEREDELVMVIVKVVHELDYRMVVKEIEDVLLEEMEKFRWWFEQDIDGENEDDNEIRLMMVNEEEWKS